MIQRHPTREVPCGSRAIGGRNPIWIEAAVTTKSEDVDKTIRELRRIVDAGGEIVRVRCYDLSDAAALAKIKGFLPLDVSLACEIHFNHSFAFEAIRHGVDVIRLSPAQDSSEEESLKGEKEVVDAVKNAGITLEVGVSGADLIGNATRRCERLESWGLRNIVVSFASTSPRKLVPANLEFGEKTDFPLLLAMEELEGSPRISLALEKILRRGLGDAIHVLLPGNPALEVPAGIKLLRDSDRRKFPPPGTSRRSTRRRR